MSRQPPSIDRIAARRRLARAARRYRLAAHLEREVGLRMAERLALMRIAPARLLDAGAGLADAAARLAARYPGSEVLALDHSLDLLRAGRSWRSRLAWLLGRIEPRRVCADLERIPLTDASVDLIWSNMALHWIAEPLDVFAEFRRVLRPGGLLLFSTLGPDSLKELRVAAGARRVHEFLDMHDLGDRLVAAGFASPVMDMEMLTVSYPDVDALLSDLRGTGQTNSRQDRPRGLSGKEFRARLRGALNDGIRAGRLPMTLEILQGHAWKPDVAREPTSARRRSDPAQPDRRVVRIVSDPSSHK